MAAIISIGTANPGYKRHQKDVAEMVCQGFDLSPAEKRLLRNVYKSTGIEYRHSVLPDYCKNPGEFEFFPNDVNEDFPSTSKRMKLYQENALKLALQSIENCVATLENFDLKNITHLITVSCTGMYAPGLDIEIVRELQLNSSTKRSAINFMGCYGAFNALKLANSICHAEPTATVLIVCVELCTLHFQKKMDLDNIISNAIFADGAAAALVQLNPEKKGHFILDDFYCDLMPQGDKDMCWHVGDSGFDIVLSSYVPDLIESGIADFFKILLTKNNIDVSEIDYFAIHPGGLKILQACEKALNISVEDNHHSYEVLKKFGNMSSATILFVLSDIWKKLEKNSDSKTIFSCAFGPGLTLESSLLRTCF